MTNDLRKEQVALLRFEKQIVGLAATLAAGVATAKAVDGKFHASDGAAAYAEMQTALMQLANVTSQAHDAMHAKAVDAGMEIMQAAGGVPKTSVASKVASVFGLG